ncbi:MAG: extracellular solute-binding protein [Bacilli bacterium]|nr:extracellular solute-binding protein [Bacilli bacterium]
MKKIIAILAFLALFTIGAVLVLQTPSDILYLLNWGEYISDEVVAKFEEEYHCQVVLEVVTSSEAMYQKITSNTTQYDVAIPGDYAVTQLYKEGWLMEADIKNDAYPYIQQYDTIYTDDLKALTDKYMVDDDNNPFSTYYFPYFWGAYTMIYNTSKPDTESVVKSNGFEALYNRSLYSTPHKIGMYDTSRWIVSSYLMANGYDPNITDYASSSHEGDLSNEIQNDVVSALKEVKFDEFGNDALKRNVATGALDLCFTQLGDFFDTLALVYDEANFDGNVNFNCYVPDTTAAFFDSMIIPTTCQNYDLANAFINFMLNPENAFDNACAIGYSPCLKGVVELYEECASDPNEIYFDSGDISTSLTFAQFLDKYPMYLNPVYNSSNVYMLEPKEAKYLTTCETIFNSLA